MINLLGFDEEKLIQDEKEIEIIANSIKKEAVSITEEIKNAKLTKLLESQDKLLSQLSSDYDKLLNICGELIHITKCIEESRKTYNQYEEKISDLLDKIKI